jgi:xanthine/CO dehydrogenase XdhC/CoxF family maturation factor
MQVRLPLSHPQRRILIRRSRNSPLVLSSAGNRILKMGTIAQRDLYRMIDEANARGERVIVATVALTRGSTPQQRGAKMLFFENGEVAGTVGGGCIEAEVWSEAREAMRSGKSALHHFSLTAEEASEEGMVCGGTMDIFIDVIGDVPTSSPK